MNWTENVFKYCRLKESKRKATNAAGFLSAAVLLFGAFSAHSYTGLEPTTEWNVTPQVKQYDKDSRVCPTGSTLQKDLFQSAGVGQHSQQFTIDGITVTANITVTATGVFDFQIVNGFAPQVFVKSQDYLLYQYSPPVTGATNSGAVSFDTGLHTGVNAQGSYQGISHLDFCLTPIKPLTASKTAEGSYDRKVTWTLKKSVDDNAHEGVAGEKAGTSNWSIVADKSETSSNFEVKGTIRVTNPNGFSMFFTVTDMLDDTTVASIPNCPAGTKVEANSYTDCGYIAAPATATALLNTATVTWNGGSTTAKADVPWTEKLDGDDKVTLGDLRVEYSKLIGQDTNETFKEDFFCSEKASDYDKGSYSYTAKNEATLKGANTDLNASADVKVTCTLPALKVTKDGAGTYDRTVTWKLDKTVDVAEHMGNPGDKFNFTWTVNADKTEKKDNYKVTGKITIKNEAAIAQTITRIVDKLIDDTVAAVDCPTLVVQPAGELVCTYTAAPLAEAIQNNVTVSAAGNDPQTASAKILYTEKLIGNDNGELKDDKFGYTETISLDKIKTFPETYTCPTDYTKYVNGVFTINIDNEARLIVDTTLTDSERVVVTCKASKVELAKLTNGVVNPEYDWTFALYEGPAGFGKTPVGVTSSSKGDEDGILDFGNPALGIGKTYTICELGLPAGWTATWESGTVYNPDAPENLGNTCVDFVAGAAGTTITFSVNNTYPGGDPRTPGYWKNWSSCGGKQYQKTLTENDPNNEFWSLDEAMGSGIYLGDFLVQTCDLAVHVLNHEDQNGKKFASDPAYKLARNLLAAKLNVAAGAETCPALFTAIADGDSLLSSIGYAANGPYLKSSKDPKFGQANTLAGFLDQYNNGNICSP